MSDLSGESNFGDSNFAEYLPESGNGSMPSASRFSVNRKSCSANSTR